MDGSIKTHHKLREKKNASKVVTRRWLSSEQIVWLVVPRGYLRMTHRYLGSEGLFREAGCSGCGDVLCGSPQMKGSVQMLPALLTQVCGSRSLQGLLSCRQLPRPDHSNGCGREEGTKAGPF